MAKTVKYFNIYLLITGLMLVISSGVYHYHQHSADETLNCNICIISDANNKQGVLTEIQTGLTSNNFSQFVINDLKKPADCFSIKLYPNRAPPLT